VIRLLLLAQLNGAYALPVLGHSGAATDLPQRIAVLCGGAGESSGTLLNREGRLLQEIPSGPAGAKALRDLGCLRALLAVRGTTGREGLMMGLGESYEVGAARSFAEALLLGPTDSAAAEGLALLALDLKESKTVPKASAALAAAVAVGNTHHGPVLQAAAITALERGDESAARRLAEKALSDGHDSTAALLVLARLSARHGDSLGAMQQFIAAGGASRAGSSRDEFDWHLQWFISPTEDTVWRQLADAARATWIRDRLVSRDIRDGRPVGSRVTEHFVRLEFVETHFRLHVPLMKRNQLLSGIATGEQYKLDPRLRVWPDRILRMGTQSCDGAAIPADSMREYRRWQLDFDDRGVAWMRYGAPEKRLVSYGAPSILSQVCNTKGTPASESDLSLAREAWLYHVDGQSIILSFEGEAFDGSVEATRFVTRVLGDYFCTIDTKRCNASSLFRAGILAGPGKVSEFLTLSQLEIIHEEDRTFLARVITTDDNSKRVEHPIGMVGALFRLWDPATGTPRAVTVYALKVGDLQLTPSDDGGSGAVFDLTLRQWDPGENRSSDTTLTRRIRIPAKTTATEQLTGALVVPSSSGVTAWSLLATQGNDRQGRAAQESAPPLDAGGLTISDIVLGEARQGLTAMVGNTRLVLAPTGAVDRKSPVNLYFQLRSASARSDAEMTVALYPLDGAPRAKAIAALEIRLPFVMRPGVNEVERMLDVSRLVPGAYRLEVLVRDRTTGTTTRRSTPLNIR
jgi:hypothetical protein